MPCQPRRRMPQALALVLTLTLSLFTACGSPVAISTSSNSPTATLAAVYPTPVAPCGRVACAAQGVEVFVEPDAGETPVVGAIRAARVSIWVEVYLLTDRSVIRALEDAAARHVDVRVLLELAPYGSGSVAPTETLAELQAASIQAKGANPAYHYTHEKAIVVDGATALILSANLTRRVWAAAPSSPTANTALSTATPRMWRRCGRSSWRTGTAPFPRSRTHACSLAHRTPAPDWLD